MHRRRVRGSRAIWIVVISGLLLTMAGTGYAGGRYVITSKKQIAPKVRKQLEGHRGARGPQGAQGPQGPQGPQGAAGPPGTARASAQVATGVNPTYDANRGFPSPPRRIGVGKYCIPAPAGVNPDTTAVLVGLSGGSAGFVSQYGPPTQSCRANEFEIWTANTGNVLNDSTFFNIVVP
jgi:hypothetical protein